jgi:RNA polymerase sigma factor (sigma-70 family)
MSQARVGALPIEPEALEAAPEPPMERAARRDRRAFERLYATYHQEIYRYCLSILRRREDAEDALQATMAAALRALPGEKREIALRPWLFRVAHNESITLLRQRRRSAEVDEEEVTGVASGSAADEAVDRDRLRTLVADLRSLPERQSSALVMRELSGLDYDEIGEALTCSGAAARQTVYEARSALRGIEEGREMDCTEVRHAISDRDGRRLRGRKIKAHIESCDGCRGFAASIDRRKADLGALFPPLPAMAATAMLSGLLGGGGTSGAVTAGTVAGVGGGGIGGVGLAGSAAIKGASVLAAAVLAAGAADVSGVIDLPLPGGSSGGNEPAATPASNDSPAGMSSSGARDSSSGSTQSQGGSQGDSGHAPGNSGTNGKPGHAPGHSGSSPGNSANAPGHSSTAPGNSGSAPGQSATSPGNSSEAPGHSATSPGNSGSAPGHSSVSPGNSAAAPGHSSVSPGNSASAPGHSSTSPGNSGSAPGQTGSPGNSGSAPGHVNVPPLPPIQTPTPPGLSTTPPGQGADPPGNGGGGKH